MLAHFIMQVATLILVLRVLLKNQHLLLLLAWLLTNHLHLKMLKI